MHNRPINYAVTVILAPGNKRERYVAEGPELPAAELYCSIARRPVSVDLYNLGPLNLRCVHCSATQFSCERVGRTVNAPQFSACCDKGRLTDILQSIKV